MSNADSNLDQDQISVNGSEENIILDGDETKNENKNNDNPVSDPPDYAITTNIDKSLKFKGLSRMNSKYGIHIEEDLVNMYGHLLHDAQKLINNMYVNSQNYLYIIMEVMEMTEANNELSGSDKSKLVTYIAGKIAEDNNIFENNEHLRLFLSILPLLLVVVVDITKKKIKLKIPKKERIYKKEEIGVITYTIFQKMQDYILAESISALDFYNRIPIITFEIMCNVERYTYLREKEKRLIYQKITYLLCKNSRTLYPNSPSDLLENIKFLLSYTANLFDIFRSVSNNEFYINQKVDNISLNRIPDMYFKKKKSWF
jgi:hypothetical protein